MEPSFGLTWWLKSTYDSASALSSCSLTTRGIIAGQRINVVSQTDLMNTLTGIATDTVDITTSIATGVAEGALQVRNGLFRHFPCLQE